MAKKLLILAILAFFAGIAYSFLNSSHGELAVKSSKNCFSTINACARNGACGSQLVKTC